MLKPKIFILLFTLSFLSFTGSTFAADTEPKEASPKVTIEKNNEVSTVVEEEEDEEPDC